MFDHLSPAAARRRIAIVGASLAGLRTLEALRRGGFAGEIVVVGDESHKPYNRPPLSKGVLTGDVAVDRLGLGAAADPGPTVWLLGNAVIASDLDRGIITLASGAVVQFDDLVVASGLRPRRLDVPGPPRGRHVLRTIEDAQSLAHALDRGGSRVAVFGGGFVGCEVAAVANSLGCEVRVVAPEEVPLKRALGLQVGGLVRGRHEAAGVTFSLGTVPVSVLGDDQVSGVLLANGDVVEADVVVEAVGSIASTDWLEGNGLDLSDGVLCDGHLRALGHDRLVLAVGDVARFPLPLARGLNMRIEHWQMATETAKRAARTLLDEREAGTVHDPFAPLPSFWSDQYGSRLQAFGVPALGVDDVRPLGSSQLHPHVFGYYDDAGLVGVAALGGSPGDLAAPREGLFKRAVGEFSPS